MYPWLQIHLVQDVVAILEPQIRVRMHEEFHRIEHSPVHEFVEVLQRVMNRYADLSEPSSRLSTVIVE